MSLWWLQPGWTETCCAQCGQRIWPEGDPDHGVCFSCFNVNWARDHGEEQRYDQCQKCGTDLDTSQGAHVCGASPQIDDQPF